MKRINEAWKGSSPIAVHCSAGVGRSGTLIAIDSLIQQLEEEGEVNIYQSVCELRHQRNYLVQSVVSNPRLGNKYVPFYFHSEDPIRDRCCQRREIGLKTLTTNMFLYAPHFYQNCRNQ